MTFAKLFKASSALAISYMCYTQYDSKIELSYLPDSQSSYYISKCPSLSGSFYPTPWLCTGVFQALYGAKIACNPNTSEYPDFVHYKRDFYRMPDDGMTSVDWKFPESTTSSKKILLIAPGLTGGSHSQYIREAVNYAASLGYQVGVMHGRGISGTPLKSFNIHHLCSEEDYGFIISEVQSQYPDAQIVALGTSMGAGLLLKHAGASKEKCLLKAIVAVAAPFDYVACRAKLHSFWPYLGFSDSYILQQQKDQLISVLVQLRLMNEDLEEKQIDIEDVLKSTSSQEFDRKFTIKVAEHKDTEGYYKAGSSEDILKDIKVPVLALSSKDDPVVAFKGMEEKIKDNPKLIVANTKVGGHVGFFEGIWQPRRWYPKPCLEFFEAVLNETAKQ